MVFQEQIKSNPLILAAQQALAVHPPDYATAAARVGQ
jgi:hypothetical protein